MLIGFMKNSAVESSAIFPLNKRLSKIYINIIDNAEKKSVVIFAANSLTPKILYDTSPFARCQSGGYVTCSFG